jgi:hypothetical protein
MRSFGVFDTAVNSAAVNSAAVNSAAVNSAFVNSFDPYFELGRENQYRFLERKLSDADHPIVSLQIGKKTCALS